jgi:hypothetical protein
VLWLMRRRLRRPQLVVLFVERLDVLSFAGMVTCAISVVLGNRNQA